MKKSDLCDFGGRSLFLRDSGFRRRGNTRNDIHEQLDFVCDLRRSKNLFRRRIFPTRDVSRPKRPQCVLTTRAKYVYRELLTLDRSGDEAMDDLVKAFDGKVFRNIYADDYYRYANRVNLSANEVYVPLGKTLSVSVTGKEVNARPTCRCAA